MTVQQTYETLCGWLNSCITDSQIDLVVNVADEFLCERLGAVKEFEAICEAATTKRSLPAHTVSPYDNMR